MLYVKPKDILAVMISALLTLLTLSLGWLLVGPIVIVFGFVLLLSLLMTLQLVSFRRMDYRLQRCEQNYTQVEALFSLYSSLRIRQPLPAMRGWAISPDFANTLVSLICECKPNVVVEASSGVSTLVAAYCLEALGTGSILALEHDEHFAALSASHVAKHGLTDVADVIHAPLTDVMVEGRSWLWYSIDRLCDIEAIDMLVVDGPPSDGQHISRYPALPLLLNRLSSDAVILVDDASREEDKDMVRRWLDEFTEFTCEVIPAEKGAVILRRKTAQRWKPRSTTQVRSHNFAIA